MNQEQHGTSLNGLAMVIARRLQAIRDIAAEKNDPRGRAMQRVW
jgi:hypothetical protein